MENVIDILNKYNQTHIINIMNSLSEIEKKNLEDDVKKINFEEVFKLYEDLKKVKEINSNNILPLKAKTKENMSKEELERITKNGEEIIKEGKYAVVTVAGGQGTRLRM